MREAARLLFAVEKLRPTHQLKGRWVGTMMPRRQESDDRGGGGEGGRGQIGKENHDPVAAFSSPPPIPPFMGPLVVLSLLQPRDGNDVRS
ncbi:unnamed protein product [Cuscuta campestris]|uniref:Uncharacterized protein n=1 Tax=Cuscuta campestris TaxID=132261 RepID=A0A484KXD1_9ASTE|nr:unnamed protein product [Cuscuta campestris]